MRGERDEETDLLSTIGTIRLGPLAQKKTTPLGGNRNIQMSLFLHRAKMDDTPGARDVNIIMSAKVLIVDFFHLAQPPGMLHNLYEASVETI